MKANELMIGDWVVRENYKNNPMRVIGLTKNGVTLKTENGFCGEAIDFVEPIPLTLEILEKNIGNKQKLKDAISCADVTDYRINFGNEYVLSVSDKGIKHKTCCIWRFNRQIICIQVQYVHELQHALRLCGLNDLADNFKV